MIKAFPSVISIHNGRQEYPGMELRDYFAARAMGTLIEGRGAANLNQGGYKAVSIMAYLMADEMIKAREQHDGMEEKTSVSKD